MGRVPGPEAEPADATSDDAAPARPGRAGRRQGTAALVLHVAKTGGTGTYVDLVGEYQDEYVRTEGRWRFRRRTLVPIDAG